jgi:hypothetical protein
MPRAAVVLSQSVRGAGLAEADIRTNCPSCGLAQRLDEALYIDEDPYESYYRCASCMEPVLIVSTPSVVPWEGRGYQVGSWVIRNPSDVYYREAAFSDEHKIPAAPDALI